MKAVSAKQRVRIRNAKTIRHHLIRTSGGCMICRHGPDNPWRSRLARFSQLACHEIARGPSRTRALDKPYAILVVCGYCHDRLDDTYLWPQARQLAVLQRVAPQYYDLGAFNHLVNPRAPNRITQEEVDQYKEGFHHAVTRQNAK